MDKYEIPGFEGFTFANNGRTNMQKRVLTNKDAIALLIDSVVSARQRAGAEHLDANGRGLRITLGEWRDNLGCKHQTSADFTADKKFSAYFNEYTSYGYCGRDGYRSPVNVVDKDDYRPGRTKSYSAKIVPFWYRSRRGHYALTKHGEDRVKELKETKLVEDLATRTWPELKLYDELTAAQSPAVSKMLDEFTAQTPRCTVDDLIREKLEELKDLKDPEVHLTVSGDCTPCNRDIVLVVPFKNPPMSRDELYAMYTEARNARREWRNRSINPCRSGTVCMPNSK